MLMSHNVVVKNQRGDKPHKMSDTLKDASEGAVLFNFLRND
jgi:hypothetical protein